MNKRWFVLIALFLVRTGTSQDIVTNPLRRDGFGGQFQTIIYSAIYAELNGKAYRYTPFTSMEHNYDNDSQFLQKKEELINFIGNFEINKNLSIQSTGSHCDYIRFFENNLQRCADSLSLKKIKQVFRSNKERIDYFDDEHLNIAVHIRRPNPHDSRIEGTNTPDRLYINIINALRDFYSPANLLFHIYSQGDVEAFKTTFCEKDIVFHINEPLEKTFTSLVLADVLVTSPSSLSYTAGILSEGTVYYVPFWHPPLPHWITIAND